MPTHGFGRPSHLQPPEGMDPEAAATWPPAELIEQYLKRKVGEPA